MVQMMAVALQICVALPISTLVGLAEAGVMKANSQVQLRGIVEAGSDKDSPEVYATFTSLFSLARSWRQDIAEDKFVHSTELFCAILSTAMVFTVIGFFYQWMKQEYKFPKDGDQHSKENLEGTWRYGFFDVRGDRSICLISCCCPVIRWADTVSMSSSLGFWAALFLIVACIVIAEVSSGIGTLAVLAVFVWRRQQLRHLFHMSGTAAPGAARSCIEDCLAYTFCSCCAIMQEARQIEEAHLVGHPISMEGKSLGVG